MEKWGVCCWLWKETLFASKSTQSLESAGWVNSWCVNGPIILLDVIDNRKEFSVMNFRGYTTGGKKSMKINFILFGEMGVHIEIESDFFLIILIVFK